MTAETKSGKVEIAQEDLDCLLLTLAKVMDQNRRLRMRRTPTKRELAAAERKGSL